MATKPRNHVYRILFTNDNKSYEIYSKHLSQSQMFGFIKVEGLIFNDPKTIVLDPSEERLRTEFSNVKCFYVPMHSVSRIDVVEREGIAKVIELKTRNSGDFNSSLKPMYTPSTSRTDKTEE